MKRSQGSVASKGLVALILTVLFTLVAGCTTASNPTPTSAVKPSESAAAPTATPQPVTIKFGFLPIVDSLLFFVADAEGYYKEEGLNVELQTFTSARDMDVALSVDQIQGEIRDVIGAVLLNKNEKQVYVVQKTLKASEKYPYSCIVSSPKSSIASPQDLKGKKIAVGANTVIEFLNDKMLEGAGVSPSSVEKLDVASIPARLTMLTEGQVDAATFPEPAASVAVANGAKCIVTDSTYGQGFTVFRRDFIEKNSDAVDRFLRATVRAAKTINANPEKYKPLLAQKANLPDTLKDSFAMRVFPEGDNMNEQDLTVAVQWMKGRGLITQDVSYADIVTTKYLKP